MKRLNLLVDYINKYLPQESLINEKTSHELILLVRTRLPAQLLGLMNIENKHSGMTLMGGEGALTIQCVYCGYVISRIRYTFLTKN